jgi:hypothetical protein
MSIRIGSGRPQSKEVAPTLTLFGEEFNLPRNPALDSDDKHAGLLRRSPPDRFQTDGESLALKKLPTFRNDQASGLVYVPNIFEYAGTMRLGIMGIEAGVSSGRL